MPILHFHGKFLFHMPEYDNYPSNDARCDLNARFDPNCSDEKIFSICGSDPSRYFEFTFQDVKVKTVTYSDGNGYTSGDIFINQTIDFNGILVDVSPSAECAQLFAPNLKIGNLLTGTLQNTTQSELRLNLRPLDSSANYDSEQVESYFQTTLKITDKNLLQESRFIREIGNSSEL